MSLLIDGYNLLHVTDIFGDGPAERALESSRNALLGFLAANVQGAARGAVTIVFDAKDAPPGLPRCVSYQGITVHYAAGYAEADELLEELIQLETAPKRLRVISSDHRVQRAARRRGAKAVDSDVWFASVVRERRDPRGSGALQAKPTRSLSADEVEWWLREFGMGADDLSLEQEPDNLPAVDQASQDNRSRESSEDVDVANPFPPGYGEDLLDE